MAVSKSKCDLCDCCNAVCPTDAIDIVQEKWHLIADRCIGCEMCVPLCPNDALYMTKFNRWNEVNEGVCEEI